MPAVLRPLAIYFCLLVLFRVIGKRALGEITNFDFVVLLIVSESVSSSLVASDSSITGALLAVTTLLFIDLVLSILKQRSPWLARFLEDQPTHLIRNGKVLRDRMEKERVDEDDILEAARRSRGIERLEEIKGAVLERQGSISIIPAGTADRA